MIESISNFKDVKDVDVIFLSCHDHNEGTNNHGLFQMHEFFKKNVKVKSVFASTLGSIYENSTDIFDISHLGNGLKLAQQINLSLSVPLKNHPHSWLSMSKKDYIDFASSILIENFPNHKFIAIADKSEVDLPILEAVMRHFKSNLLILSAVNNTWTGFCSYPDEFNCEKFKTEEGCRTPCPALVNKKNVTDDFVQKTYESTKNFVERNFKSVYLNVGNLFSYKEASESAIFKDVEKVLIPLKNIYPNSNFEDLWDFKMTERKKILDTLKNEYSYSTDEVKFVMMWSAHDIDIKRKGIEYFVNCVNILKYLMKAHRHDEILLIISAKLSNTKIVEAIQNLNIKVVFTGHVDREVYNSLLSASDVYCSTTLSDAGPRTTYESAALATPVVSFDKCNAADFVNQKNGALIETYDVKRFAEELYRLSNFDIDQRKQISLNMYKSYQDLMDTRKLSEKWESFFKRF